MTSVEAILLHEFTSLLIKAGYLEFPVPASFVTAELGNNPDEKSEVLGAGVATTAGFSVFDFLVVVLAGAFAFLGLSSSFLTFTPPLFAYIMPRCFTSFLVGVAFFFAGVASFFALLTAFFPLAGAFALGVSFFDSFLDYYSFNSLAFCSFFSSYFLFKILSRLLTNANPSSAVFSMVFYL